MSKSARIAILSSLASRSSLTPPAVSSASPRSTPTPPPKWKPQKQAPPRSSWEPVTRICRGAALLRPSLPHLPFFFRRQLQAGPSSFAVFNRSSGLLSAILSVFCVSALFFQLSTLDFQLPSPPRPCTMNFHRGYSIPHVR